MNILGNIYWFGEGEGVIIRRNRLNIIVMNLWTTLHRRESCFLLALFPKWISNFCSSLNIRTRQRSDLCFNFLIL